MSMAVGGGDGGSSFPPRFGYYGAARFFLSDISIFIYRAFCRPLSLFVAAPPSPDFNRRIRGKGEVLFTGIIGN